MTDYLLAVCVVIAAASRWVRCPEDRRYLHAAVCGAVVAWDCTVLVGCWQRGELPGVGLRPVAITVVAITTAGTLANLLVVLWGLL